MHASASTNSIGGRCCGASRLAGNRISRPFGAGLGGEVDGALDPDIVEMRVEEVARRAAAAVAQHHEEIIVGAELAVRRKLAEGVVERDAMQLDAAVLARPGAV